jgi:transmembrane sensor
MTHGDSKNSHLKEIILRFLEGRASDEEIDTLHNWLEQSEANRKYFDDVNTTFQASVTMNRINHRKVDSAWEKVSKQIKPDTIDRPAMQMRPFNWLLKIAASVCLIALVGLAVYNVNDMFNERQQGIVVRNSESNNTRILLPDGSSVWLNANSVLEYAPQFGVDVREVILKGEAFFDVTKSSKPFIVRTEGMQVHVKGTRFNVEAYRNTSLTKTTLEEGRVELHVNGKQEVVVMQPGEQVTLDKKRFEVSRKKVDPADFSAWKEEKLVFDNKSLAEIITKLENRYKVDIQIDSSLAKRERITMTLEGETLEEVLDMIRLSSRLKIKADNNSIIISE